MEKIRIGIIDDHAIVVEGLSRLFESIDFVETVFATTNGCEGQKLAIEKDIDVLVLDVRIPGFETSKLVRILKKEKPQVKIICLSSFDSPYEVAELLDAGVSGYLIKSASLKEILKAIRTVMKGNIYIDEQLEIFKGDAEVKKILQKKLTQREIEIARFIIKGMSNKEISSLLKISEATVKTHIKNIMEKLGTRNRAEIVFALLKEGMLHEEG